jgi:hypothetical protein
MAKDSLDGMATGDLGDDVSGPAMDAKLKGFASPHTRDVSPGKFRRDRGGNP